jgi:lysine 2,3-aminomutase
MGVKNQFQVPILRGYEIVEQAKHMQNGNGKCFRYAMSTKKGKVEILGPAETGEMLFKFHQAKNPENQGRLFLCKLAPDTCWVEY